MLYQFVEFLYISLTALLALYGINAIYLTLRYWTLIHKSKPTSPPPPAAWPQVTIQLPLYNEKHVVRRLLEAVAEIDYPRDLLEIQVLDDSTDDTVVLTQDLVARLAQTGLDIQYIHRPNRDGFKAGALAYGLARAKGEFVAVFDADFVPPRDFLKKTIPYFEDPGIGCVQTRWGYLNPHVSAFARALSVALDGHYVVEKNAQYLSRYFINFNGSAGVWRKKAIETSGGWQSDTLTEDLDLSIRAQLCGWRFAYEPQVICPAELPFLIESFRRQQFRWAKGSTQAAGKLLKWLWTSKFPPMVKLEASLQLIAYLAHPLMLIAAGLTAILSLSDSVLPRWLPVFSISLLGLPVMLFSAQVGNGRPWYIKVIDVIQLTLAAAGLTPTSGRAVFEAILGINSPFLRTPKFASEDEWMRSEYSLHISPTVWAESITMIIYFTTIAATYSHAYWGALSVIALPLLGQFYLMSISLSQTSKLKRKYQAEDEAYRPKVAIAKPPMVYVLPRTLQRYSNEGNKRRSKLVDVPGSTSARLSQHDTVPMEFPLDQD